MIRHEVSKGSFKDVNIRQVAQTIREHDLNIISNYIFGFPDDTLETMQQTLDLALELNSEMANMYPCQALPGSALYYLARTSGWALPDSPAGYGFLSYDSQPMPTSIAPPPKSCASATTPGRNTSPTPTTWTLSNASSASISVATFRPWPPSRSAASCSAIPRPVRRNQVPPFNSFNSFNLFNPSTPHPRTTPAQWPT